MTDASLHTTHLTNLLDRMRAGDVAAADQLLVRVGDRLERLARKMLHDFPGVHRWEQTDDVLQNALLRLVRSLRDVRPESVREFFGLAAVQIRRELLDLARHYRGRLGPSVHQGSARTASADSGTDHDQPQRADEPDDMAKWSHFHEEVDRLPAEEREVVGLVFYHGWSQAEIADLLQVSVRTVGRRWQSALLRLHHVLRDGP